MADVGGGDVFLFLPWVLLKGGAYGRGVVGLDLLAIGHLLQASMSRRGRRPLENDVTYGRKVTLKRYNV